MEYKYICPQCGKEEIFKKESTLLKKLENKEVCRRCKAKNKDLNTTYSRKCPECGREILYKYKSDYNKALVKSSLCKSCAVKHSTIFTEGHTFNDLYNVPKNNLDKLLQALNIIVHINKVKDTNTVTIGIYKKDYIDMFLSLIDKYKITCLLRKWKQIM